MNTKKILGEIICIVMVATAFTVTMSAYPAGWGDDIRLTYASGNSIQPEVAIDSNDTIYVVWQDDRDGNYNIYLKKSKDYGKTWSSDIKVTDTLNNSGWSRISIDSNDVLHLLWLEENETWGYWRPYDNDYKQILYKNSGDGGITWSSEVQIASNTGQMQQRGLDISIGKDDVLHVAFSKYSPSRVYYRKSTDGGSTWSTPKVIGDDRDCARALVIASDSKDHVYVAFNGWNRNDHMGDIQFIKSDDNGDTWRNEITLIGGIGWATHAHLAATDDGHVFLTYIDNLGVGSDPWSDPREIYIIISLDYAQSWGSRIRLTYDDFKDYWPINALDSQNNSHIVWYDNRDGNWEIYYTKVDTSGNTLIDDTRLTDNSAVSGFPVIAIDLNGSRHLFWHDNRTSADNYEIYYKGTAPYPPVADAGPNQTVYIGNEVQFNGSNSYDPDGNITNYMWDFNLSDGLWWETGAPPDAIGPNPNNTYNGYGVFIVTLNVTDNDGNFDSDTCVVTVMVPPPPPPTLYINTSLDGKNATLYWDQPPVLGIDHYLIYRSTSQTNFDFNTVWKNTSINMEVGESSVIPLRTIWNDTNAAFPGNNSNYEEQYYYIIRAVNILGQVSSTSRTVGKWTKTFPKEVSTFSLPLEPLQNLTIDHCLRDMGAKYIKWMHPGWHKWMKYGDGGINDTLMKVGEGYEVKFDSQINYTFTGMPGAMISYDDDSGFLGLDHTTEAKNLTVTVELNGDVNLTWPEPSSMSDGWYEVYFSNKRDGFFGTLNMSYFSVCPPINFGKNTTPHVNALANQSGARLYYMVVPYNASGVRGASTYSIAIWTEEYLAQYDTFGIPLKLETNQTADWYCDNIPETGGINYYNHSEQRWCWHSTRMPSEAYDPMLIMTEGYQISTSGPTKFKFIGR
jgi:hypothetical protein